MDTWPHHVTMTLPMIYYYYYLACNLLPSQRSIHVSGNRIYLRLH